MNVSVIEGYGAVDGIKIEKGTHFILPIIMVRCGLKEACAYNFICIELLEGDNCYEEK